jgi:pimeloyl-ACP methyl ester carboxylesterase
MSDRLHIHWAGRADPGAPTIVLLHGITNSGAGWVDAVQRWASEYRIAAIDALGHGRSDRFTDVELEGEGADVGARAIEALVVTTTAAVESIVHAASDRVVLLGHSMGGATASVVAARRPDLLRGVLLEDPSWPLPTPEVWRSRGAAWLATAQADRLDPDGAIQRELADSESTWPRSEIEPWVIAHTQVDDRFVALGRTEPRDAWVETVASLAIPTLVVTGTEGVIIDGEVRDEIARIANPHVDVAVVDGAGHSVRRDRGDAFHAIADPWIRARWS